MKKLAALAVLALIGVVGPARADNPKPPTQVAKCVPNHRGFKASGTLISATLTAQRAWSYNGPLEVNVTKANHRAPPGNQTYTLTDARV